VDAAADGISDAPTPPSDGPGSNFSFFVTSLEAMRMLSGSQNGFGGDLGGLAGADKICQQAAELGLPGAGQKNWRAFLSATTGGAGGGPVHAIDRIGPGPWFDRVGRMFAPSKAALVGSPRPTGGSPAVAADMPNERGEGQKQFGDNHDTLTGSDRMGQVQSMNRGDTCNDWTSAVGTIGRPNIGHSWPRNATNLASGGQWIFDHTAPGCAPGVNITSGGGQANSVGGGGGFGGLFCFVATP
jgi:hypothetical protein